MRRLVSIFLAVLVMLPLFAGCIAQALAAGESVVFRIGEFDEDTWYCQYLRQQGIVPGSLGNTNVTEDDLDAMLNRGVVLVAQAGGGPLPQPRKYWNGATDGAAMYEVVAAFKADCEEFNPQAQGAENFRLFNWYGPEMDLDHLFYALATIVNTETYIASFSPEFYTARGVDFLSEWYDLGRIGKTIEEVDFAKDYDFERLAQVEAELFGVDRNRSLTAMYRQITADADTPLEEHLALLSFVAQVGFTSGIQPLYEDGAGVQDPLVLLELGETSCGYSACLACDLFSAGGYNTRLVQAGAHTLAEVYYEDDWHYFDAHGTFGLTVMVDGVVPSMKELSRAPWLIDSLGISYWPVVSDKLQQIHNFVPEYRSIFYFGSRTYTTPAQVYVKTKDPMQMLDARYGWGKLETMQVERMLYDDMEVFGIPCQPAWQEISVDEAGGTATLRWQPSTIPGGKGEIAEYRVYVSAASRGWDWEVFYGPDELAEYRSLPGYDPIGYPMMQKEPPRDAGYYELPPEMCEIEIPLAGSGALYVSVTAIDRHGKEVGNIYYPPSNEIALP